MVAQMKSNAFGIRKAKDKKNFNIPIWMPTHDSFEEAIFQVQWL
jgi:hypothetical protein